MSDRRKLPNLIITGTPGCGKTSHLTLLCDEFEELRNFQISEVLKKFNCFDGFDEGRDSNIVDEDKLLDLIEPDLEKGGVVVDWHVCDIFPERLIDLVIVLRCDNEVLYDRLSQRGYKDSKIEENLDVEIMEVIVQDARESYDENIVIELHSETTDMIDANVDRIAAWYKQWLVDHPDGVSNLLEYSDDSESDA